MFQGAKLKLYYREEEQLRILRGQTVSSQQYLHSGTLSWHQKNLTQIPALLLYDMKRSFADYKVAGRVS
jgi:hypothetical protein